MALRLTCPFCAAIFSLPEDAAGKKASCPKCGAALVVTSAGVAKGNEPADKDFSLDAEEEAARAGAKKGGEPPRPVPARPNPARGRNPLWLLLALPVFLLLFLTCGLAVYLFTRGRPDDQKQVVQDGHQPHEHLNTENNKPGLKKDTDKPDPERISVKPLKTLGPLAYGISPLAFSADDKILAAGGWSDSDNTSPWDPTRHPGKGEFVYGKDRHWHGEVKLWEVSGGNEIAAEKILARPQSLAFGPDAKTLLIASDGVEWENGYRTRSQVEIWDFAGNKVVKTIKDGSLGYYPRLSPAGKLLAFRSRVGVAPEGLHLWDVGADKRIEVIAGPLAGTFSPDGKLLATEDDGGFALRVWRVDEGRCTATLDEKTQRRNFMFAFSHDNKTLAAGFLGKESMVKLFDVASGKYIATIDVLAGMPSNLPIINSLAFSPDGKLLAVGTNTVSKLWDVATGKAIVTLSKDAVLNAVFSHDGKLLAVGAADGKVTLWEITRKMEPVRPESD